MIKHRILSTINNEKIVAYAMAFHDEIIEFTEEQLIRNDPHTIEIIDYAMSFLKRIIKTHEEFINNFEGDKESLAQVRMVARYKQELKELNILRDELIES